MDNNPKALPPQFVELEPVQGWRDKTKNWFRNNSSIILAVVIIIVLAGGIYAYTQRDSSRSILPEEFSESSENLESEQQVQPQQQEAESIEQANESTELEVQETPAGIGGPIIAESEVFTETAQKGDGVTHLARRALASYLEKTGGDAELTKEHKVYIEDYLQNKTSDEMLETGQQKTFLKSLIEEAIQKSKTLTSEQLQNIAPFAQNVNL